MFVFHAMVKSCFDFLQMDDAEQLVPLIVAGGGGGNSFQHDDLIDPGGGYDRQGPGLSALSTPTGPGNITCLLAYKIALINLTKHNEIMQKSIELRRFIVFSMQRLNLLE